MGKIIKFPRRPITRLASGPPGGVRETQVIEHPRHQIYNRHLADRAADRLFWEQVCAFRDLVAEILSEDARPEHGRQILTFYFTNWYGVSGFPKFEKHDWLNRMPFIRNLKFYRSLADTLFNWSPAAIRRNRARLNAHHKVGLDPFTFLGLLDSYELQEHIAPARLVEVLDAMGENEGVTNRKRRQFKRAYDVYSRLLGQRTARYRIRV